LRAYRIDDKKDGKHLNCDDDTLDTAGVLSEVEMGVIFVQESFLCAKRMSYADGADDFFGQGCTLCIMIQRPFLMFLHDCRCYNDGNAKGGDNADEHECHLPLLDERNNESREEH
jgi:hypothetical protein